ncbi:MAG: magnesium transporter [Verrucomicrobiales bacterium]
METESEKKLSPCDDPEWMEALKAQHPHDIAVEIRDLPTIDIRQILRRMHDSKASEVIVELPPHVQVQLLESMRVSRLSGIIEEMFSDDVVDLLGQISAERLDEIMNHLPPTEAREISDLLEYDEDTAGGIMQTEVISVSEELTIAETIEKLRSMEDMTSSEGLFYVYVTDQNKRLRGVLRVRDLLFRKPELRIRDIMIREVRAVSVHADQEEIARLFKNYGFTVVPVVDDFQRLRGLVTSDDVMHILEEEATEDMQRMIGLSGEESTGTPWKKAVRNRLPWLYVNLATAFLAGSVVAMFESTIAQYAVLAVFLPIIAGQGGNAGTQVLTIVVRSLALGDVPEKGQRAILLKELFVGLLNGLAIGVVVGAIAWAWKQNIALGVVVFAAMLLNMVAAGLAGVVIPFGLKALRIDPALASAIMLTTVTDVVGFFLFLGFAAAALAMFPLPL